LVLYNPVVVQVSVSASVLKIVSKSLHLPSASTYLIDLTHHLSFVRTLSSVVRVNVFLNC
jgi:hypothetical protein